MKVRFERTYVGDWYWAFCGVASLSYTRRRDAVRGFNRFINQTRNVMIGRL